MIRPELVNQPSFVSGFESEARLVAQLEHPHLVPLYDYWRDPEGAYLVMRWLRGGSLRQALERGPWNLEPASRLLSQVAGALAYAHRHGRHPPRRQAREHPARRGRERVSLRLRDRGPPGRSGDRAALTHVVTRVRPARAAGRSAAHATVGHLRARLTDVRAAHRSAAADGRGATVGARDRGPSCRPRSTRSSPAQPRPIRTSATSRSTDSSPRSPRPRGARSRRPRRTRPRRTRTRVCRRSAKQTPPISMDALRSSTNSCRRSATGAWSRS